MNEFPRSDRAVLISLEDEGGEIRLRLDDLISKEAGEIWQYHSPYTNKLYPRGAIEQIGLSEKELADFGFYVLARLNAFREVKKKSGQ